MREGGRERERKGESVRVTERANKREGEREFRHHIIGSCHVESSTTMRESGSEGEEKEKEQESITVTLTALESTITMRQRERKKESAREREARARE